VQNDLSEIIVLHYIYMGRLEDKITERRGNKNSRKDRPKPLETGLSPTGMDEQQFRRIDNKRQALADVLDGLLCQHEELYNLLNETEDRNDRMKLHFAVAKMTSHIGFYAEKLYKLGILGDDDGDKFISDQATREHLLLLKAQELEAVNLIKESIE
jgi:hypothetical protein